MVSIEDFPLPNADHPTLCERNSQIVNGSNAAAVSRILLFIYLFFLWKCVVLFIKNTKYIFIINHTKTHGFSVINNKYNRVQIQIIFLNLEEDLEEYNVPKLPLHKFSGIVFFTGNILQIHKTILRN